MELMKLQSSTFRIQSHELSLRVSRYYSNYLITNKLGPVETLATMRDVGGSVQTVPMRPNNIGSTAEKSMDRVFGARAQVQHCWVILQ